MKSARDRKKERDSVFVCLYVRVCARVYGWGGGGGVLHVEYAG